MTTDQVFFILLFVIGIPLGVGMFRLAEKHVIKNGRSEKNIIKKTDISHETRNT